MSHAILHSLISQHCAHWTHCCTHTHYRTEQETTYAVPETTTRQKSLVKDHLHSFLVASAPSRETLIYQEKWAVVPFLTLGWGQDCQGDKEQLYFAVVFSFQLPEFLVLSFSQSMRNFVLLSLLTHLGTLLGGGRRWKQRAWHTCNSKCKSPGSGQRCSCVL